MRNRMKELREDADLSQEIVAKAIGITQRKYSYVETRSHQLTAKLIVKLAQYYHVSADYLLGLTDDPTPRWILRR